VDIDPSRKELDLIGVISPVCLLKCKSELAGMETGDQLEVLLQDPGVVEALVKIVERSEDEVLQTKAEGNHFRIWLKKGKNSRKEGQARYFCMKHDIHVSEESIRCRDPEIYCKFRSSCPIWFMDKRGGESIDEDKTEKKSKTNTTGHSVQERESSMPNDVYKCEKCNHSFEKLVLQVGNESVDCPKCGNCRVKRFISSESFMSDSSIGACCINAPKDFS
jgi:putative FmdB family regulatory protein